MRRLTAILVLLLAPCAAWAHGAGADEGDGWENLSVILALGLFAAFYLRGYLRLRRGPRPNAIGPLQGLFFAASLLTLGLSLLPPLSRLGEELFSFHMAQHLTLMLVAAPLLVACRPVYVGLWALPRKTRRAIAVGLASAPVAWLPALLRSPLFLWLAFTGVFVFWHLPGPYVFALSHGWAHALEHVSFLLAACGYWDAVIEPSGRRRLDYGAAVLYVATSAVLSSMPGALMVLTQRAIYGGHAHGAAQWGLTEVEDQQLAGLIMWIPAGFAYLAAIVVLLALWLREGERRSRLRIARMAGRSACVLLATLLLAGCDDRGSTVMSFFGGNAPKSDIGDVEAGRRAIATYGCGACHEIPGITGARGLVGPPLDRMGRRIYIAGLLRNNPENMVSWLRDPQKIVPGNAMPKLGLTEEQARNVAAYLSTLN